MPRGPGLALLTLLLLAPALAAPGLGQGNGTAPPASPAPPAGPPPAAPPPAADAATPFEPLPPELLAVAGGWLGELNASIAAFRATHPLNTSGGPAGVCSRPTPECFRDGAWDYLNESRLTLAMSQVFQADNAIAFEGFYPPLAEGERRNASLGRAANETLRSQEQVEAFLQRLRGFDPQVRNTHALEYATLATMAFIIGDDLVRNAPNTTQQLAAVSAAEERIVRLSIVVTSGPQSWLGFAGDLLDLAERVNADARRPPLPANGTAALREAVNNRMRFDPDASSTAGPQSTEASGRLHEAEQGNVTVLHFARFLAFEQARAADALGFRRDQGTLSDAVLAGNLRTVAENASWLPRYDGFLETTAGLGLDQQVLAAGYQDVLLRDARNHAYYRLQWDVDPQTSAPRFNGVASAWSQAVAARYAGEAFRELPSPRAPGGGGDLLLYGGIAVAAAVAVIAVAVLRKH